MDKKTFTLGILSLTAVLLFVANLVIPPRQAEANFVVKDRDYQAVTALYQANDEALFVLDNRSGQMACFTYNPQQKSLALRDLRPIMSAFPAAR
ncbi:MAG TPA: hypothetical protein VGI81_18495 [Tepidisphaeraceae bacterium]|jgi:hypothetical protein